MSMLMIHEYKCRHRGHTGGSELVLKYMVPSGLLIFWTVSFLFHTVVTEVSMQISSSS
jgi:hypothetical protein